MKVAVFILVLSGTVLCNSQDENVEYEVLSASEKDITSDPLFESPDFAEPMKDNGLGSDLSSLEEPFPGGSQAAILTSDNLPVDSDEGVSQDKTKNEGVSLEGTGGETNFSNSDLNNTAKAKNKTLTVECILREVPDGEIPAVNLTNSTVLQAVLTPNATNATAGECAVVLFFSSQCVFSARMAPHYNALARVFPGITFYALDTVMYSNIHVRYGIVSVPNVLLFHHGKPVARCNDTHLNLENLVAFVTKYTNLKHNGTLNVTSADMNGPVPATLVKKVDYVLILAWVFTIFCLCLGFVKSPVCHKIVECVRNTWLEAEAQHEHTD